MIPESAQPPPYDPEAFKRFEHAGWEEVGRGYHEAFSRLTLQAVEPMLDAAGVAAGARLLDVACGPGYAAAAAARRGARVVGVDFSSAMIQEARTRHPGLDVRQGDAEQLPFPDAGFDAVTMGFGMLHLARPERAMVEAFRVLRPGGRFAFTVWDAPERALTFGLVLKAVEACGRTDVSLPPGPPFFLFSDPEGCRRPLLEAGFLEPSVRTLPLWWRVESADALVAKFLRGGVRTRALLRAQTPETIESIRAMLEDLARPYEREGALELPAPCVLASARKG